MVVGRENELDLLQRAVRGSAKGDSACIVLVGEGGIGKTRLLGEAITMARRLGCAVLTGRVPIATRPPYGLVASALRSWLRAAGTPEPMGPYDQGLVTVLPEWPATRGATLDDAQQRLLALESIVQLLRRIAVDRGALVVLDDVHAADAESTEAMRYIANAAVPGVVVLAATRHGEHPAADEVVRALRNDLIADVMPLSPLDERGVSDLVAALLDTSAPPELVEEVIARTDGVPLLVEEIVLAHLRAGPLGRGGRANVPRTIRELAEARLDLLTTSERNVVVAGAVLGDFEPSLIAAVADADDAIIGAALSAGVRVGLLEQSGGTLAFRHAVIRDAVLDATVPHLIEAMHRRSVIALDALPSPDAAVLDRLADHLVAVAAHDEAAAALARSALVQLGDHALLAAEQSARRALTLAATPPTRAAAADALATVLGAQGRWSQSLALDELTVAEHGENTDRRRRMASAALEAGRPEAAEPVVERALAAGDDSPEMLLLDGRLAVVRGDAGRALSRAAHVLDAPQTAVDDRLAALDLRARALDFVGDRDGAERTWKQQAHEGAAAGRAQSELRAIVQLGKLELFAGRPPDRLYEAVERAREAGALVELGWAQENLGIGLCLRGQLEAGQAVFEDAVSRCRALRLDQLAYLLASRGMTNSHWGDDYEADFAEAERLLPSVDLQLHLASLRADIDLRAGRYDEAVAWFQRCNDLMASMPGVVPMDAPCWLVWALAAAGRADEAVVALEAAKAMPDLERWFGRPMVVAAAEALLRGDVAQLDAVLVEAEECMPMKVAEMRVLSAHILGGDDRARWLRAALDWYESCGATAPADRVRRQLREAGGAVPRRRAPKGAIPAQLAAAGVTAREADVLRLLGDGMPNAEVATRLYVSVRTVEAHVSSLLAKLQVRNRAQLAAISTTTPWP